MVSTPKTHPLEWVSLGFAVVALSYSEWSLAVAAGAHPVVAAAVPGALDVYAVRAMRVRRHVPGVVLAMVGVNALSYLVHAGVVPMKWPVLVLVSAIAPLVFWAVHSLGHGEAVPEMAEARKRALWDVPRDAVLGAPPEWAAHDASGRTVIEHTCTLDEPVPYSVPESSFDEPVISKPGEFYAVPKSWDEHVTSAPGVLDFVPEEWATVTKLPLGGDPGDDEHRTEHGDRDGLATVLPLPEGFTRAPARRLEDLLPQARVIYGDRVPTLREVKEEMRVGTDKARDIVKALELEHGGGSS